MFVTGFFIGLLLFAVYAATRSVFRVDQGHTAVLTSFGAAVNEKDAPDRIRTYAPGLHAKAPWQKVHVVPIMEQSLDLSGEKGGQVAMAEDGTVLRLDSILRFVPIESELREFLFRLASPLDHVTGLFTCFLRNEIANFRRAGPGADGTAHAADLASGGAYAIIRRDRRELNARIEEFCRTQVGKRYGIKFSAVDLTDILPPDELAEALNAVMHAQTEADSHHARAEADARQRVLAAERGVEIAKERAKAAEDEIRGLIQHLETLDRDGALDAYVRRRRAEVLSQSRTLFVRSAQ